MSEAPLVTIITPTYNAADLLAQTIDSVLTQGYRPLEYVVIDDGSTDATPSVVAGYGDRIRAERHENRGEAATVNRGFELARGEIVAVVNADDPLLPGAVAAAVERFGRSPALLVVYPDWNMIDEHGDVIEQVRTWDYDYVEMLRRHHCVPGPGAFFRRSLVEQIGGRDTRYRYIGDLDFWLRAGLVGPFERIPQVLASFRVHSTSASVSKQSPRMAREHVDVIRRLYRRQNLPPGVRRARREAFSSAFYIAGAVAGDAAARRLAYWTAALALAPGAYVRRYADRRRTIMQAFRSALGGKVVAWAKRA